MTREQALTRKVAQLRKVAEGGDNTLAIGPMEQPEDDRAALQYAIAAVVLVAIIVLGIGLFAATQAGLFDGLENRIPFLRPKVSAPAPKPKAVRPVAAPAAVPNAQIAPGNQPAAPVRAASAASAASALSTPSAAPAPKTAVPAVARPALPREPESAPVPRASSPQRPAAAVRAPSPKTAKPAPKTSRAATARRAAAVPTDDLPSAPSEDADDGDGEIPAYAQPRPKAANLGEIILRASVQAAVNIDKENMLELYNRYALGFPGLSGEVVIGLTVDPSGRVLEGSVVSSTTGVEAFDQELLRRVLDWRLRAFPESRPKFISVPFLFPLQGR
jgi:TonB family protein